MGGVFAFADCQLNRRLLSPTGTGTFGRVLLCRLLRTALPGLPQYFAMKVLSKYEVVRLKQIQHINSERAILGSVQHNGIVNLCVKFSRFLSRKVFS